MIEITFEILAWFLLVPSLIGFAGFILIIIGVQKDNDFCGFVGLCWIGYCLITMPMRLIFLMCF